MADNQGNTVKKILPFGKKGEDVADKRKEDPQEQLLQLFEKRNELKREFSKVLDELETLRGDHSALVAKSDFESERLEGLEKLLADPNECQNAIVYYRLVGLWSSCRSQLEKRRAELEKKYEELEKLKLIEDFKAHAVQQQKQLEQKFAFVDEAYQEKAESMSKLQSELVRSNKPWHFFKRKRLAQQILEAEEEMAPAISQREECLAELERVRDREPPAWKGLSVKSIREINLQLIALAQYLVVHFGENDIAKMAKATQDKQPGDWRFGTNEECMGILRPIRDIVARLKQDDQRAERIQRRVSYLRESVTYKGNADTLPEEQGLARINPSPGQSESLHTIHAEIPVNVLDSGFWGLGEVVIREK